MRPFSVCLIGNSHVAALKLAWSNRPQSVQDGFSLTFFSAQNRLMNHIKRKGPRLIAADDELAEKLRYTSGGKDTIELKDYDAFVIAGSGFGVDVRRLSEECGTLPPGQGEHVVSQACFSAAVQTRMDQCMALELVRMIRTTTEAPVVLVGAPFISERELTTEPLNERPWFKDRAFLEPMIACCRAVGERVAKRARCEIVWQAEGTYTLPGFTSEAFNNQPVRFTMKSKNNPEFDAKHGNEEYGALMLSAILSKLDALSGGRVLMNAPAQKKLA